MNISAKFNKKQSNECSDISVKNTNVNFLLHTKSSHLFLHNRKKKKIQSTCGTSGPKKTPEHV